MEEFEKIVQDSLSHIPAEFRKILKKEKIEILPREKVPQMIKEKFPGIDGDVRIKKKNSEKYKQANDTNDTKTGNQAPKNNNN